MSAVWAGVDACSDSPCPIAAGQELGLTLHWLDLSVVGLERSVVLSALPGGFGSSLSRDLDMVRDAGVTTVVSLCLQSELEQALGSDWTLSEQCAARGLGWLHLPVEEGGVLAGGELLPLLDHISSELLAGGCVLLHCVTGLGRTCTVGACVLQHADERLSGEDAVTAVQRLCGPRAVQSVAQLNAVLEFRQLRDSVLQRLSEPPSRPVSR